MDENPKTQALERIRDANNILVTVSANPSVDQLAACIGLTLLLNKMGKHATAVFSGAVPSTIEFLSPEKTLEANTDSLRDFIIALDKSKADKLRYKVEDEVVRIFITPYRTSISEKDLDFSQGDFNVDVVIALGVTVKEDIDQAISAHGRILHDAVVIAVTDGEKISDVGSINWHDQTASSLSEMLAEVSSTLQADILDAQMSTAFLTGIVAETDRFSNDKTSPKVMTLSAQLMAAGANQQLIATKLAPPPPKPVFVHDQPSVPIAVAPLEPEPISDEKADGVIEIDHNELNIPASQMRELTQEEKDEIHIDEQGNLNRQEELEEQAAEQRKKEAAAMAEAEAEALAASGQQDVPTQPGQQLPAQDFMSSTAHKVIEPLNGFTKPDPLGELAYGNSTDQPVMNLPPLAPDAPSAPYIDNMPQPEPLPQANDSLAALEQAVDSPHAPANSYDPMAPAVDDARQAVEQAGLSVPPRPEASQALGAQHIDLAPPTPYFPEVNPPVMPSESTMTGVADILQQTSTAINDSAVNTSEPMSPPPVPPPMMPPYNGTQSNHRNTYLNPQKDDEPNPLEDQPL